MPLLPPRHPDLKHLRVGYPPPSSKQLLPGGLEKVGDNSSDLMVTWLSRSDTFVGEVAFSGQDIVLLGSLHR
jgi:hypothetical protein